MRVLVVVPDAMWYGGALRFLERLLAIHVRKGISTALLAPLFQGNNSLLTSLAQRFGAKLFVATNRVGPETPPFMTPFLDFLFLWPTVQNLRPDLIVVSTVDPGRMSALLYFPVPVLYILHSMPEHRFRLLPRCYLHIGSLFRNLVATVSDAAATSVSRCMGVPRRRIEIIHNSCAAGAPGNGTDGRPVVLTVGHLVDYKNPWFWLEIARSVLAEHPDSLFVWLGEGDLLEPLAAKVREMSLEERILLPGYLEDPSVWYRKASVYLQPSRRESHGIAVLEAMAHGVPCVVADVGGMPESVLDGVTGHVCPLADPRAFIDAVTKFLGDAALRERMGSAGRERAAACFSEEIQEQKLLSLYAKLSKQTVHS